MSTPPERSYIITIKCGADTPEDICRALEEIIERIYEMKRENQDNYAVTSGSPSSGFSFTFRKTATVDGSEYARLLNQYLKGSL
jgi:hypothetical protein